MKKHLLVITALVCSLSACKKSTVTENPQFATTSETLPQFDNTSFGVYKGIIMGTDGSIKITINNGNNTAAIYHYVNNTIIDTLTTTYNFVAGQPIINAMFTGRRVGMTMSTNSDGSNVVFTDVRIIGISNPQAYAIHEESFRQVYCFEGTYSGDDNGIFKCMAIDNLLQGYVISSANDRYSASAPVTNNSFNAVFGNISSGATFYGQFTIIACAGNWTNTTAGEAGSFRGPRTL